MSRYDDVLVADAVALRLSALIAAIAAIATTSGTSRERVFGDH